MINMDGEKVPKVLVLDRLLEQLERQRKITRTKLPCENNSWIIYAEDAKGNRDYCYHVYFADGMLEQLKMLKLIDDDVMTITRRSIHRAQEDYQRELERAN